METELIVTFLAWFLGGFVNIITGIGGNLMALPVMLLGLDFTVAAVVSCVIGALLGVMLVLRFYRFADARSVLLLSLGALPGLVAGVLCLKYLPIFWLEIFLGCVLIAFVVWEYFLERKGESQPASAPAQEETTDSGGRAKGKTSMLLGWGSISGLFSGVVGLGGIPLAVCVYLNRWDKNVARGILGAFFVFSVGLATGLDVLAGLVTESVVHHSLAGIPGMLLGTLAGLPVAGRIPQRLFQRCLLVMVLLGAFSLLARAFLQS